MSLATQPPAGSSLPGESTMPGMPMPGMPDASVPTPGGQPLDPQQRKAYDLIVRQALGVLLQGRVARYLVQRAASGDPQQAVVDAVSPLLRNIYAAAQAAGAQVDMVTLLAAGINIVTVAADLLARAGILQQADIPAFCSAVAQRAVQQHNAQVPQGAEPAAGQGGGAGGSDGTTTATAGYGGM